MSNNNYISPYYFTQPPPTFNTSHNWNYNWPTSLTQPIINPPSSTLAAPPPPPPPYPPPKSPTLTESVPASVPALPPVKKIESDQDTKSYYNSNTTDGYNTKRYTNSTTGQYNDTSPYSSAHLEQYNVSPGQYNATTGQYNASSGQYNALSGQYNASSGQYKVSPGQYKLSPGQYKVPSGQYKVPPEQYKASPGHYNASLGQYNASPGQYNSPTGHYNVLSGQYNTSLGQYAASSGQYKSVPSGQYKSLPSGQYMNSNSPGYGRNYYGKRKPDWDFDGSKKSSRKKKKSLSQNVPQRKDWSVEDARQALMMEKDYNKRNRSMSLIIKFPDMELNRDIVSTFSPAIESVHFQQPSTPRFCFVTLKDSVDPEEVIKHLNETPFGNGFLTAEFKKDREDEINIGPEDIDPLTLYVGNLAQEVTKEDMVNAYPKQKRIDIGYAKKMKYTRYAFVSFKKVEDSLEAFRKTHATQMYSKSLIVRFRRLNGTVGMPGEPKPQMPQRSDTQENQNDTSHTDAHNDHNDSGSHNNSDMETDSRPAPWEQVDVSTWESNLMLVKEEPLEDTEDDEYEEECEKDTKPPASDYVSPFMPGSLDLAFSLVKPKVKIEIKDEPENGKCSLSVTKSPIKEDFPDLPEDDKPVVDKSNSDCLIIDTEKIKQETDKTDAIDTYDTLRILNRTNKSVSFAPIKIKREVSTPTLDEHSSDHDEGLSTADTEDSHRIKSEPNYEGDETNDGDNDSSDSDDFNFSSMLCTIEARKKKRLKKTAV